MPNQDSFLDEKVEHWKTKSYHDLAIRTAALHKQRRSYMSQRPIDDVKLVRKAVSDIFISGTGIEVGAGSRPFPIPSHAKCFYGDIRDGKDLGAYFNVSKVKNDRIIDANDFSNIESDSQDFVISAHVLEHLQNPINSIKHTERILKPGGVFLLVLPDKRFTFDRYRETTNVDHFLEDFKFNGETTRFNDYKDFIVNVGIKYFKNKNLKSDELLIEVNRLIDKEHDIHFHTFTPSSVRSLLKRTKDIIDLQLIGLTQNVNEILVVLKKN